MRLLLFISSLSSMISFGQQGSQVWNAANVMLENKNYFTRVDFGYRFTTNHSLQPSQFLGRITILKKLDSFQFGGGFAYFVHQNEFLTRNELRPFLQFNYLLSLKKHQLNLRLRNEFRFFEDERLINRMRFNLQYRLDVSKRIDFVFSPEFFYSFDQFPTIETRYQFGFPIEITKNQEVNFFYQFNWQKKQNQSGFDVFGVSYSKRIQLNND